MTRITKWLPKFALMATTIMALSTTAEAAEKPNIRVRVVGGAPVGQWFSPEHQFMALTLTPPLSHPPPSAL